MEEKAQLLFIHGGMTFRYNEDYLSFLKNRTISIDKKNRWSENYLIEELQGKIKLITPKMPLKENAKYEEWKIHFERHFDFLEDNVILVGESLGGIFLAKYLSENKFPKKILSVYFVAPPYDNSLIDEDLVGGFELKEDLSLIETNCNNLSFFFSKDDGCIPIDHAKKYGIKLPSANIIICENKNGHFNVSEFPKIVKMIMKDLRP